MSNINFKTAEFVAERFDCLYRLLTHPLFSANTIRYFYLFGMARKFKLTIYSDSTSLFIIFIFRIRL